MASQCAACGRDLTLLSKQFFGSWDSEPYCNDCAPRKVCSHCGRSVVLGGGISYGAGPWNDLCHPNVGMDCYRLVTVYQEPIGARLPGGLLHGKPAPIPDNPLPFEGFHATS